uniref:Hemocyanin C-terminal domain-containing protein n=1 Tax=Megaselia scalaris TaxID=36166 RepID=T1GK98_MEGSC
MRQYNDQELGFNGVRVEGVEAKISSSKSQPNVLLTYWQQSDIDLAAGLDFGANGNVFAHFTHLQNAPFEYNIRVTNSGQARRGTVRIFLCPKTDERGTALNLNEVRQLAIEMDKFTYTLQPGTNNIKRRSDESSITIPFERQ